MTHVRPGRTAKTARQLSAEVRAENPRDRRTDRSPVTCGHVSSASHSTFQAPREESEHGADE